MVVLGKTMEKSFKPYYNWNTFNTQYTEDLCKLDRNVLNLIITGIPSILKFNGGMLL